MKGLLFLKVTRGHSIIRARTSETFGEGEPFPEA